MHGLHQIPFATGMGEMALFQANATSNKPEAKWFQWFWKISPKQGPVFTFKYSFKSYDGL